MRTLVAVGQPVVQPKLEQMKGEARFIYGHRRPYQTLVYPDHLVEGERNLRRWPYLEDFSGKRIVDLGCSSAQDGILALLCGAEEYIGYDLDWQAISLAKDVARAWGVQPSLEFQNICEVSDWPEADVAFCFSITKHVNDRVLLGVLRQSAVGEIWLESHYVGDSTAWFLREKSEEFTWRLAAEYDSETQRVWHRKLWQGKRRGGRMKKHNET